MNEGLEYERVEAMRRLSKLRAFGEAGLVERFAESALPQEHEPDGVTRARLNRIVEEIHAALPPKVAALTSISEGDLMFNDSTDCVASITSQELDGDIRATVTMVIALGNARDYGVQELNEWLNRVNAQARCWVAVVLNTPSDNMDAEEPGGQSVAVAVAAVDASLGSPRVNIVELSAGLLLELHATAGKLSPSEESGDSQTQSALDLLESIGELSSGFDSVDILGSALDYRSGLPDELRDLVDITHDQSVTTVIFPLTGEEGPIEGRLSMVSTKADDKGMLQAIATLPIALKKEDALAACRLLNVTDQSGSQTVSWTTGCWYADIDNGPECTVSLHAYIPAQYADHVTLTSYIQELVNEVAYSWKRYSLNDAFKSVIGELK